LHDRVRWDSNTNFTANDIYDFEHAAAAVAYCDDFFTEDFLTQTASRPMMNVQLRSRVTVTGLQSPIRFRQERNRIGVGLVTVERFDSHYLGEPHLNSDAKCNTPALDIGMVDQDLRECCHAMLFAFVG
jgi:hypothetical protein